jgi:hypothetical protein
MKVSVSIVFVWMMAFACTSKKPQNKFDQFSGLWQTNNSETDIYESWKKIDDSTLYGKSYAMNGPDTMIFENIQLKIEGNNALYIPTVTDQNEGKAIPFKMTRSTDTSFTFENAEHDFPQKITYRFIKKDSLVATVEGIVKGELRMEEFFYHRIK